MASDERVPPTFQEIFRISFVQPLFWRHFVKTVKFKYARTLQVSDPDIESLVPILNGRNTRLQT